MNAANSPARSTRYPIGLVFDAKFIEFSVRFTVLPRNKIQFHIDNGIYAQTEVVNMAATCIRPGIFLVSWTESSCATVVHVEDFIENRIHSHATLPDGTFLRMEGALSLVNEGVLR
ncbi:MoaF-related domain-containing protein [Paucibacter sp. M5-1]|uniref:MoaF-related domain-containing protein n=1 Tax=Paucibacter sp. M5-1 TaxID=3015998 RepID=UPI0022B8C721|nr:hypothetical protein [Paucibacter sp. M5-1]MCZ7880595.1 hypothetical protein [Paucibacter sp. M5-1]